MIEKTINIFILVFFFTNKKHTSLRYTTLKTGSTKILVGLAPTYLQIKLTPQVKLLFGNTFQIA